MHIDDLIILLSRSNITANSWDTNILYSFADQINRGTGFTEKQASVALKMVKRFSSSLSQVSKLDISEILKNPTYRYPIRQISNQRKISVLDSSDWGRTFKVEFPYNETYITEIRQKRDELGLAQWSKDEKAWLLAVDERNISFLSSLMAREKFQLDEQSQDLFKQQDNILENMEKFVPMLVDDQGILKFKNISPYIPELETQDLLKSVFEARKRGILTWDDTVYNRLNDLNLNEFTKIFIEKDPAENLQINCEKYDISVLGDVVKHLTPVLVVIPGGNELGKLKLSFDFLKNNGFKNEDMSVMFRLPTSAGKEFNDFVKDQELNSPIGENTKAVFVSSKLPKPVLKSKIKFHSVINLGFENVHYTMRDFLKNHENLIFFSEKKSQREFNFGLV